MATHNIKQELCLDKIKLAPTVKGALAELLACQFLMSKGYEVFRNLSPTGSIDIVAIKQKEIRKIDVKLCRTDKDGIIKGRRKPKIWQKNLGIEFLCVSAKGQCYFESDIIIKSFKCRDCGVIIGEGQAIKSPKRLCESCKAIKLKKSHEKNREKNKERMRKSRKLWKKYLKTKNCIDKNNLEKHINSY
jgi:hypothetical protein